MSQEFEEIKNAITAHKNALKTKDDLEKQQEKILTDQAEQNRLATQAKIDADKIILKNSGVIELFQKIADSGLVKSSDNPVYIWEPIYKKGLIGRKYLDHYEKKLISEYTPATISESENTNDLVSVTLFYDTSFDSKGGDSNTEHHCKKIKIAVLNKKLNLVSGKSEDIYTPIEDGKLADTITEAIKHPPIIY